MGTIAGSKEERINKTFKRVSCNTDHMTLYLESTGNALVIITSLTGPPRRSLERLTGLAEKMIYKQW